MNSINFFVAQKNIIENFFSSQFNEMNSNHPAYKNWILCNKLIKQGGIIKWPEDKDKILEIASIIFNGYIFLKITGGDVQNLSLGNFVNYGDERARKKVLSEMINEKKFFEVILELSSAAWYLSKNYKVKAYEMEGYPDFEVNIDNLDLPVAIECKYVHQDKKEKQFNNIINKAGKQIKKLGKECYGVLIIDISSKVNTSNDLTDSSPQEVLKIQNIIKKSIYDKNTSISAVLLIWHDFIGMGKPKPGEKIMYFWRKRSNILYHNNPKFVLPKEDIIEIGNTVQYSVTFSPRK